MITAAPIKALIPRR